MSGDFFLRMSRSDEDPKADRPVIEHQERGHVYLLYFLLVGLAVLVVGAALLDLRRWPSIAATAFLLGSASLVSGGIIGLLFGVPRVVGAVAAEDDPAKVAPGRRSGYVANTNLERVSDWLTAIIVGVTLTQLGEVPGMFQRLVNYVTGPFGDTVSPTMVAGTVVLFLGGGFIFGFLWSRFTLGPAFLAADRKSLDEIVDEKIRLRDSKQP